MASKLVNITPDKSLLKKLGFSGYGTEHAIAELIDNSIDARTRKGVSIYILLDFVNKTISVDDDGVGMDLESLRDAMTVAKTLKAGIVTLGEFGLGMKSACSTLGSHIKIVTSKESSNLEYSIDYDEDEWLASKTSTWDNFEIHSSKKTRPWHGTRIQISNVKVAMYPHQSKNLRLKFTQRFEQYLRSEDVNIFVNNTKCTPDKENDKIQKQHIHIDLKNENSITGWIGLKPTRSIGTYGFSLYRNKRLVRANDKFGFSDHPTLSMITGELNLEHVPINYHKTQFIEDSPEYVEALEEFSKNDLVRKLVREARNHAHKTGQIISSDILEGASIITPNLGIEKASRAIEHATPFSIEHNGHKVMFSFESLDINSLYHINDQKPHYEVVINTQSPAFRTVRNPAFLVSMIWTEVKIVIDHPGKYDKFIKQRNEMWTKFVQNSPQKTTKRTLLRSKPNNNVQDMISINMIDVYDVLNNFYSHRFQLTSLSILDNHLNDAYGVLVYTIITEPKTGTGMQKLLAKHFGNDFAILVRPKRHSLPHDIDMSDKSKFIIIYERSGLPLSDVATYEKALVDLYRDITNYDIPLTLHNLRDMTSDLINDGRVSEQKLISAAKRYNLPNTFYREDDAK